MPVTRNKVYSIFYVYNRKNKMEKNRKFLDRKSGVQNKALCKSFLIIFIKQEKNMYIPP